MFPTHCYRSPGPHSGPPVDGKSTTFACLGVNDAAALVAALADGWHLTLPEAVDPSKRVAVSVEEAALASPHLPTMTLPEEAPAPSPKKLTRIPKG
jgi:hypothetical protein